MIQAGCATVPVTLDLRKSADALMEGAGFVAGFEEAGKFKIKTYARTLKPGAPLHVYIEGDGMAWRNRTRLSDDPTPIRPTVLNLAASDPAPNILYVARPGQYLSHQDLSKISWRYWSDRRFSEEVVTAIHAVIDRGVREAGGGPVHLIGYSGGGALAVLLAARRPDVASIRTVAGNLDPPAVCRLHGVSPLLGSLNPAERAADVARVPQIHFVGSADGVIPESVARGFVGSAGDASCMRIRLVEGATHESGWDSRWRQLLTEVPICAE